MKTLNKLIKLANYFDKHKLYREADIVDAMICVAVKYSGKDSWKYESSNGSKEFSKDSSGVWSQNTSPDFIHKYLKEIARLEVGQSVNLMVDNHKIKITRTSKIKVDEAKTPYPPEKNKLVEELKCERKSLGLKRRFISNALNELSNNDLDKLWAYLDKGRGHEEWRLEFSDEPDDDPLVSSIPLTEKTTDQEIVNIAEQLIAAVQKIRSAN